MGSDATLLSGLHRYVKFQSTLPGWGATLTLTPAVCCPADFNPRSPDGERHSPPDISGNVVHISIHAPRMGSDKTIRRLRACASSISIHAPRMGSDNGIYGTQAQDVIFQSTLPGWGATCAVFDHLRHGIGISIHAPRMGSDLRATSHATRATHFNPRSPDGERLPRRNRGSSIVYISIHAPRMGSDCRRSPVAVCFTYFNPRSPDGERLRILLYSWVSDEISIHAPRMGSDYI